MIGHHAGFEGRPRRLILAGAFPFARRRAPSHAARSSVPAENHRFGQTPHPARRRLTEREAFGDAGQSASTGRSQTVWTIGWRWPPTSKIFAGEYDIHDADEPVG